MYPATLEGLFNAVKQGNLVDVNEVLSNIKVNINEPPNILNYLLIERVGFISNRTAKISLLIAAGVKPQYDPNVNTLLLINNLSDNDLIQQIISLIKQSESFKHIYHQAHFDAINGKMCDDNDTAFKEDAFGLYPIHYAIAADHDTLQWHTKYHYDLLKPISSGYYEGINLLYFYLEYGKYKLLAQFIDQLTIEQRYKLLQSSPENQLHRHFGLSFTMLYIYHFKIDSIAREIQPHLKLSTMINGFSQNQRLSLLRSTILNPEDHEYGLPFAWLLTSLKFYDELKQLLADLSPQHYIELLKSAPSNPNNIEYKTMLIWNIAIHCQHALLDQLTRDISAEELFDLLMCAPLHPQNRNYKMSLAWLLLFNGGNTNFLKKCLSLPAKQRFELLNTAPQNPKDKDFNVNLASLLIDRKEYELFMRLIVGMSAEQIYELLKTYPLNSSHPFHGSNVPKILISRGRYDVIIKLFLTLNEDQILSLLLKPDEKENNTLADFVSVVNFYAQSNQDLLLEFLERFNSNKFYQLMLNEIQTNKDYSINVCYILIQKITLRLNVLLKQPTHIHKEHHQEIADEIKSLLAYLIEKCWHYLFTNNIFYKCYELIGMTISDACHSPYKSLFSNAFANDPNYEQINKVSSEFALEGFGHYLRIISGDKGQALSLSRDYALDRALLNNKNTALLPPTIPSEQPKILPTDLAIAPQDEIARLKQQIESLQKENEMLKKAALEKDQEPKTVGNDPRLFGQTATQQLPRLIGDPVTGCDNLPRLK